MTTEHESIRSRLALASSGGLSADELRAVLEHTGGCESCRRELEVWGSYARGLQQLPQPEFPADLLSRAHGRVMREHAQARERRRNALLWGVLTAFSWLMSFSIWIVVRTLTRDSLEFLGTNLVSAGPWILVSSMLALVTAGSAAVTLGNPRHARRFQ